MKIRSITLDEDGDPTTVTAELNLAELVYLSKFTGKQQDAEARSVAPRGDESNSAIYDACEQLLLKFWDEGASDAAQVIG